jgi:hypothetical protein
MGLQCDSDGWFERHIAPAIPPIKYWRFSEDLPERASELGPLLHGLVTSNAMMSVDAELGKPLKHGVCELAVLIHWLPRWTAKQFPLAIRRPRLH